MTGHDAFDGPLSRAVGSGDITASLLGPDEALPAPTADDRSVWDLIEGTVDRPTAEAVLARAGADLASPWPQPLASQAARVHRDGDREVWEGPALARQQRLSRATIAAAVTLDARWIDEVADGIVLLCEQSSWCWPAHDDTRERHGAVIATVTDPFVDLGAGEVIAQLAWIDHLLGTALDDRYPGLRARMRHESRVRVFEPFLSRRDWHWIGLDGDVHNWNPWIHGNVLTAALRLLGADDPERAEIVRLCWQGMDRYVASLPDDGAIDEGYAYWWNGACRALEALDVLAHATAGSVDPTAAVTALRETVAFPHRTHLGGPWYLNLADGQAKPPAEQPWHALHRAAVRVGDDDARAHAASHRIAGRPVAHESEGLGRLARALTDPQWVSAQTSSSPLPARVWLAATQVMLAREHAGSRHGLTLAVKGGHNGEHHNHNDVGSFVVASDGVPVLVDAGRPTYTKQTFGPGRYDIWTMQSSWHNLPDIRGVAQSPGEQYAASGVSVAADGAGITLDLSGAYEVPGLRAWKRSATLAAAVGNAPARVTILDEWSWDAPAHEQPELSEQAELPTTVNLIAAGEVEVSAGGARIVPRDGATAVRVSWPPSVEAVTAQVRELDDPMLSEVWGPRLTRISLTVTACRSLAITVERDETTGEEP